MARGYPKLGVKMKSFLHLPQFTSTFDVPGGKGFCCRHWSRWPILLGRYFGQIWVYGRHWYYKINKSETNRAFQQSALKWKTPLHNEGSFRLPSSPEYPQPGKCSQFLFPSSKFWLFHVVI